MSAERITYLDSSAIVKLVVHEPESAALARFLRGKRPVIASALARVEVCRACRSLGSKIDRRVRDVFARVEFVRINDRVIDIAAALAPHELRTLDAIHLATASLFGDSLARVVTYDARMATAARAMGWSVSAPA
jgi:uncharacterized protein